MASGPDDVDPDNDVNPENDVADDDSLDQRKVEPKRAVIGIVPVDHDLEETRASLRGRGVAAQDITVLDGDAGAEVLAPGGTGVTAALGRLLSDVAELRDELVVALEQGKRVLAVTDVDEEDGPTVKAIMQDAGLARVHHFGEWAAE